MRRSTLIIAILAVVALALPACSGFSSVTSGDAAEDAVCVCADGKAGTDVWCADCGVGYVGGKKATSCKGCFSAKTGGDACTACSKSKSY
ncbi:MAG TPA: hypothetical protein EYN79_08910 [Planctomycetes bacterium]|nr:hypothetical protein [Planctomycetota bacterium]HIN80463.1 hypothetical protein [Planctomycetota bacterium]